MALSPASLVTRALGIEARVNPHLAAEAALPGDVYLLCSDGLNDMLLDADIAEVLGNGEPPDAKTRRLVDLATQRGGRDNVSVIVVKALEPPKKSGMMAKLLRK